jgi:hypothetical protein
MLSPREQRYSSAFEYGKNQLVTRRIRLVGIDVFDRNGRWRAMEESRIER